MECVLHRLLPVIADRVQAGAHDSTLVMPFVSIHSRLHASNGYRHGPHAWPVSVLV